MIVILEQADSGSCFEFLGKLFLWSVEMKERGYSLLSDGLGGVFSNFHPVSIFLSGGVPSVPFSS